MEEFDLFSDDESDFGSHGRALHLQCANRSPEFMARLYLRTRLHLVMKLKGCTLEEALRYVEQRKERINKHVQANLADISFA